MRNRPITRVRRSHFSIRLDVERTGQRNESHIDIVPVEGPGRADDRVTDVAEIRSGVTTVTIQDIESRAIVDDGAQVFAALTNHMHRLERFICLDLEKLTPPRARELNDLSRS